jgi:hypothetical protein
MLDRATEEIKVPQAIEVQGGIMLSSNKWTKDKKKKFLRVGEQQRAEPFLPVVRTKERTEADRD